MILPPPSSSADLPPPCLSRTSKTPNSVVFFFLLYIVDVACSFFYLPALHPPPVLFLQYTHTSPSLFPLPHPAQLYCPLWSASLYTPCIQTHGFRASSLRPSAAPGCCCFVEESREKSQVFYLCVPSPRRPPHLPLLANPAARPRAPPLLLPRPLPFPFLSIFFLSVLVPLVYVCVTSFSFLV